MEDHVYSADDLPSRAAGVCLYLMAEKPNSLDNVIITPQPGFVAPTTPDAHGRPPGDAHYGHDHP